MLGYGKVIGGHLLNATITPNLKGDLALQAGGMAALKKRPTITAETVAGWEETFPERSGGASGAMSLAARAALPGFAGKAAAAAIKGAKSGTHTVRIDWADGNQSLIELPDKLFQHLALELANCRIASEPPPPPTAGPTPASEVMGQITTLAGALRSPQPDIAEQIAKLAGLRDQGILTEEEFAAKKTELLSRM